MRGKGSSASLHNVRLYGISPWVPRILERVLWVYRIKVVMLTRLENFSQNGKWAGYWLLRCHLSYVAVAMQDSLV